MIYLINYDERHYHWEMVITPLGINLHIVFNRLKHFYFWTITRSNLFVSHEKKYFD